MYSFGKGTPAVTYSKEQEKGYKKARGDGGGMQSRFIKIHALNQRLFTSLFMEKEEKQAENQIKDASKVWTRWLSFACVLKAWHLLTKWDEQ